jgi:hypothetical protein
MTHPVKQMNKVFHSLAPLKRGRNVLANTTYLIFDL